jgi:hypothetical protein
MATADLGHTHFPCVQSICYITQYCESEVKKNIFSTLSLLTRGHQRLAFVTMANYFCGITENQEFVGQFSDYQLLKKNSIAMESIIESNLRVAIRSLHTAGHVLQTTASY